MSELTPHTPETSPLQIANILRGIANPMRWHILYLLTTGESRAQSDLAPIIGCTPSGAGNHLAVLRESGVVVKTYGGTYRIAPQFLPTPGQPIIELGHCLLRLSPPTSPDISPRSP